MNIGAGVFAYLLVMISLLTASLEGVSNENSSPPIIKEVIYSKVPDGITIQTSEYGYGLFASKPFKKGEVIYQYNFTVVDDKEETFLLHTDQGSFVLNTTTHSVVIEAGKRALYTFDSMMNHSCDANSYSINTPDMIARKEYQQVACKDINVGDHITCDYTLFEYDCSDKDIVVCLCGAPNCRKEIRGFKWLSPEDQIKLLPQVDVTTLEQYLLDHPDVICIEDLRIPEGIKIVHDGLELRLIATREFKAGDVIYENRTFYFPEDQIIFVRVNGSLFYIENSRHTVNRGEGQREFYYFDSFMNHACDPNTLSFYIEPAYYEGRALKDIKIGDEVTCDYATFDTQADESESFECYCGADNCRKFIE